MNRKIRPCGGGWEYCNGHCMMCDKNVRITASTTTDSDNCYYTKVNLYPKYSYEADNGNV